MVRGPFDLTPGGRHNHRMKTNGTRTRRSLRVAGLFAGIGGLELGLERAKHRTQLLCECEPAAQAVLRHHFPGVDLIDDVREVSGLQDIDLLTAGFPCQDLSQAGTTRGLDGDRSGLVHEVFRIADESKVPWILIENVPFMLQLGRGSVMTQIVDGLRGIGYRWAYRIIDSRAFGLPQRRERVFLLASREDQPHPRDVLFSDLSRGRRQRTDEPRPSPGSATSHGFYWTEGKRGLGWAVGAVPTLKGGSTIGIPSPPAIWLPDGTFVTPDIRDAERLQGFRQDWTKPATKAPGTRASHRWKLVGNAVSVPVAKWLGERLASPPSPRPIPPGPIVNLRWPTAAADFDGVDRAVEATPWPVRRQMPDIADFLVRNPKPLSHRAASGFKSRLFASSLKAPQDFRNDLESYVESSEAAETR
jgi:DNA (cytosine-5)-methyltransferase 1